MTRFERFAYVFVIAALLIAALASGYRNAKLYDEQPANTGAQTSAAADANAVNATDKAAGSH